MSEVLYKITKTGAVQTWKAWVDGPEVYTEYGQLDGKMQQSTYTAQETNVGRSNHRNQEEQALFELEALYKEQQDNKHYRPTIEQAHEQSDVLIPMKLQNYKDHSKKIKFPCYVQRKFNGSRRTYVDGKFLSKIGREEENKVPQIGEQLKKLGVDVDGEVYSHGMSLQEIRSASLKPNENTDKLKLVIFDIPDTTLPFEDRLKELLRIQQEVDVYLSHEYTAITVETPYLLQSQEELESLFDQVVKDGYEGVVIRNVGSMFESGKKSYQTQKWKPRYDAEARVVGVEKCKNGTGKLLCEGADSLNNVKFKCMMKVKRRDGNEYPRMYEDMKNLIGEWITFSYEELSDKGVPTKPVGELVRKCNDKGEPLE